MLIITRCAGANVHFIDIRISRTCDLLTCDLMTSYITRQILLQGQDICWQWYNCHIRISEL